MSKVFFSYIGLSIIYIVIQLFLDIFVSEDQQKFITQLTILIFIVLLLKPYLNALRDRSDNDDFKLAKDQNPRKCKLFIRVGEEFDTDLFIYEAVGDLDEGKSELADLKVFKTKIMEKIGSNLNDYYLIREAIDLKLKSGFIYFLSDISKKIFISAITVVISGLFVVRAINIINLDESKWSLLTLLFQCVNFGLLTLIFLYMFYYNFKGKRNRALLLKSIIDLIINEKEKEGISNYSIIV
ncbi:hypothetical protein ABFY48_09680 [Lysinibacillus pakistanensis]|uniref:hypothetical protein n=1 Tax=Lysinibacillus pakistanensis TaxID=759811 RepID=UPI003D278720